MATFRFIHTADIHLDSPMVGLARYEGDTATRIRSATRAAFANLIERAIAEHVAFVVIAGDLYDGDWRDFHTGLYFAHQMGRLKAAGISVFIAHGNHDAASQITRSLQLPENVYVFPTRTASSVPVKGLDVVLHGRSFPRRDVTDDLVPTYPDPAPGKFNIGVLHTALNGLPGHAHYAPCSAEELAAKGYQYWALGHIHHGQVVAKDPYIVFPGNLQGRSIREVGPKGAHLVTVEDDEVTELATLHCEVVWWAHLKVAVADCAGLADVVARIGDELSRAVDAQADGRLLACRVELVGATNLHSELAASREQLSAEAQAAALGLGADTAWVEQVVVSTHASVTVPDQSAAALGDAVRGLIEEAAHDPELAERLGAALGDFCGKLPVAIRQEPGDALLRAAIAKDYPAVATAARDYLYGKLQEERGG